MEKLNEILYLLIYARGKSLKDNETIPTRLHLQKEIFLLQKIYPFTEMENKYNFVPLYYGPFSKDLSADLEYGIETGLIINDKNIQLSPQGFNYSLNLWDGLNTEEKSALINIKECFNRIKPENLINYIYEHYPKFCKKSALKKEVVDEYFSKFWSENNLTDEYFVEIVQKSRKNNA